MSRSTRATALPFAPQAFRPVEVHAPGLVRTARMVLRPLRESDKGEFLRVLSLSRQHLHKFSCLHREGESDAQLFARQLEMCRVGDERGTAWRRVGVLDGGRIAGCFNLNAITRGLTFEADANWWVSADVSGQGLGTEGVAAMIDYALADLPSGLGLHKVQAAIMPGNAASIRLARHVGLRRQASEKVSIRIGDRWELHEVYSRSVLDQPVPAPAVAC
ncbi:MAG TPA: GNAT family protein [Phycisphaerales bacterium]|nr:GNAT family protein [Phycisphaerales bacterium]